MNSVDTGYQCKACGAPAIIENGQILRSCTHQTTVLALCSAVVSANGGVSDRTPTKPAVG